MDALIGTGLIGNVIADSFNVQHTYNSKNIDQFVKYNYDTVYCAAPSGDRIFANQNQSIDLKSVNNLINIIKCENWNRLVVISTVDALAKDNTPYGSNRKLFANELQKCKNLVSIIRLPTLIHKSIAKNILYDIKNKNQYIKYINLASSAQWYNLENLQRDIEFVLKNKLKEINLVSEPISNQEIVDNFYSGNFTFKKSKESAVHYDIGPYRYTKEEILDSMHRYVTNEF
jgi:hypothetical protein